MIAKLCSSLCGFLVLSLLVGFRFSSTIPISPEDPWTLLPQPPILTPEMKLQYLQFNLADAFRNLLDHPEVAAQLQLTGDQKSQISAALRTYREKLGLAIENNNQLWKKVGGDQSLAEANQSALNKHQAELRNQLREILSRQQFEKFERFWFTASCNWVQSMQIALDLPLTGLQIEKHQVDREQLDQHYGELLESFQTDLEALRSKYRRKWADQLPESLRAELLQLLLDSQELSSGHKETF